LCGRQAGRANPIGAAALWGKSAARSVRSIGAGTANYGIDRVDPSQHAASYVDRILKGEKPSDLPVQQPTKFDFIINLRTAKALGLNLPLTLQMTADEVIE
jgi:ABC-type uncharacterized transport system substrate-binding protein